MNEIMHRLYIPRETCVITFLLSGVSCPRGDRKMPTGFQEGEPFGNEASAFVKDQIMQKEVEIEVETMDKGGCKRILIINISYPN